MKKSLIALSLVFMIIFALGVPAFSYESVAADYYVYVKASDGGVNLRSGPSTSYEKRMSSMIPNGEQLYISAESGKWGYTTYNGISGWIALSQTTTDAPYQGAKPDTVAVDYYVYVKGYDGGVNLRSGPSTSDAKVMSGMIPNGEKLHITTVSGDWGYTTYNGFYGWVALSQTTTTAPETKKTVQTDYYVYVNGYDGGVNLRSGPSTSNKKVMSDMIPNGEKLHITTVSGDWGYTTYNGFYGWIALSQTTDKPVTVEKKAEENSEEEHIEVKSEEKEELSEVKKDEDEKNETGSFLENSVLIKIMIIIALLIAVVIISIIVIVATGKKRRY